VRVLCVNPDFSTFRVTREEADALVRDGVAKWHDEKKKKLKMQRKGRSGGRLSCQVGGYLASEVLRDEDWALTMSANMRKG
jgi:hypothetical protein